MKMDVLFRRSWIWKSREDKLSSLRRKSKALKRTRKMIKSSTDKRLVVSDVALNSNQLVPQAESAQLKLIILFCLKISITIKKKFPLRQLDLLQSHPNHPPRHLVTLCKASNQTKILLKRTLMLFPLKCVPTDQHVLIRRERLFPHGSKRISASLPPFSQERCAPMTMS